MKAVDWRQAIGVGPTATVEEIRRAFKSYISQNHPDKNPEANLEEVRSVITGYQVWILQDEPEEKEPQPFIPDPIEFRCDVGNDIQMECVIDFFEFFLGCKKPIRIVSSQSNVNCPKCRGTGACENTPLVDCPHCFGGGFVIASTSRVRFNKDRCGKCAGRGKIPVVPCENCNGDGCGHTDRIVNVFISPGTRPNSQLRIRGKGGHGDPPGDLILHVRMKSHPRFRIEENNIVSKIRLNLAEFILGGSQKILFPDGLERDVEFKGSGTEVHIPNFGVPGSDNSHFIIRPELKVPVRISENLSEALKKEKFD